MNKTIAFFSIPAHGHINPMLPVAKELAYENRVLFYGFDQFKEKIKATGANYISCDSYLPELSKHEMNKLKKVSSSEMIVENLRIVSEMDSFLEKEFERRRPDLVFSDAVCFWGELYARKYKLPLITSTSTFAYNEFSSKYLKTSLSEKLDLMLGLPKILKEIRKLNSLGYNFDLFSLIKNRDYDNIVYTTSEFQPYSKTFPENCAFVGPTISYLKPPVKRERPLIYISMGTVLNPGDQFYCSCIRALADLDVDVIISSPDNDLVDLPENMSAFNQVDQLAVLNQASVFITHCGMNSVSESLYMGVPMVLFPQTAEQRAVARRVVEIGAGELLKNSSQKRIRKVVLKVLENSNFKKRAEKFADNFHNAPGPKGAVKFIYDKLMV